MNNNTGNRLKTIGYVLASIFMVAACLVVIDLVSTWDIIEAERAGELCTEMLSLHQSSNGEFGWPNCDHL